MTNTATAQKVKTLDLKMGWLGGVPHLYATNVMEHGDYATVASIIGSRQGELVDGGKYLITMRSTFKAPGYLEQVKNHLTSLNPSIKFANDQPEQSFLSPIKVQERAAELYNLMNFEKKMILEDLEKLHVIYVSAIRNNKNPKLPAEFEYEVYSGGLYPIRQVYAAVCALLAD